MRNPDEVQKKAEDLKIFDFVSLGGTVYLSRRINLKTEWSYSEDHGWVLKWKMKSSRGEEIDDELLRRCRMLLDYANEKED